MLVDALAKAQASHYFFSFIGNMPNAALKIWKVFSEFTGKGISTGFFEQQRVLFLVSSFLKPVKSIRIAFCFRGNKLILFKKNSRLRASHRVVPGYFPFFCTSRLILGRILQRENEREYPEHKMRNPFELSIQVTALRSLTRFEIFFKRTQKWSQHVQIL